MYEYNYIYYIYNMNIILQATKIRQQQDALETDAQDPPWKKSCITQKVFIYF